MQHVEYNISSGPKGISSIQTCTNFLITRSMPPFVSSIPPLLQALTKLEANIVSGQAYEGHELFKTVFYRCRARKQLDDSYVLAEVSCCITAHYNLAKNSRFMYCIPQLQSGSILQLKHSQANCGTELAIMLLDAYITDNTPATTESLGRILHIIEAFPTIPSSEDEDPPIERCNKIISQSLKWLSWYVYICTSDKFKYFCIMSISFNSAITVFLLLLHHMYTLQHKKFARCSCGPWCFC